jgi:hypothetical protein
MKATLDGMLEDFPFHDHQPARDDWPGGDRYGFTRERVFVRPWTSEERMTASKWKITLPRDGMFDVLELWWDQPYRQRVYLKTQKINLLDTERDWQGPAYEQYVVNARRFGWRYPAFDLDDAVRRAERRAEREDGR